MAGKTKSLAMKAYERGIIRTMLGYVAAILTVAWYVPRHHPPRLVTYVLAVLPAIPIIGMLAVMGVYLRDEKDEFLRWMAIQSLLWATGAMLALTTVVGFLQNFADVKAPPAYYVFVLYWIVFGVAQWVLHRRNRQGSDD